MLLAFHSRAAADVLMLNHHALPILRAAGKDYTETVPERGVFTAAQLPAAIAGIERAVAGEAPPAEEENEDGRPVHPMDEGVDLKRRAYPLLSMMKAALDKGDDVAWEPADSW